MRRSRLVLAGIVLVGVLLLIALGATQVWGASLGLRSAPGAPGMMGPPTRTTCEPGRMGSPGPGGTMGSGQPCSGRSGTAPVMSGTQVTIHEYTYHPMMLRVPRGTTVAWTNEDDVPHSVTFKNGMADSGLFQEGQTFRYTFQSAGTYAYYCSIHPYMHGTVVVTP